MRGTQTISVEQYRQMISGKPTAKPHKYGAKPKEVEGKRFASTKEANRWTDLRLMENAGEITALRDQVAFKLEGGRYIADFVYLDCKTSQWIVEDCKGMRTPAYRRSKKAMKERYGIEILET